MPPVPLPPGIVEQRDGMPLAGSPLAIMLDIDGTICEIEEQPSAVHLPAATRDALQHLQRIPDVHVAFVTGRGAADAARIASIKGAYLSGNHGIEIVYPDGRVELDPEIQQSQERVRAAAREIEELVRAYPGVELEDKRYTLSVHYRRAPGADLAQLGPAVGRIAERMQLRVTEGNCLFDVRPVGGADKGVAVLRLARELGALAPGSSLLFAGDDVTDEDAFRALRNSAPHAVTVSVGSRVPDSVAQYAVGGVAEMRELLERIAVERS